MPVRGRQGDVDLHFLGTADRRVGCLFAAGHLEDRLEIDQIGRGFEHAAVAVERGGRSSRRTLRVLSDIRVQDLLKCPCHVDGCQIEPS